MKNLLIITLALISLNSCTSFDDKVVEYRSIKEKMDDILEEITEGTKDEEVGVAEMTELQMKLFTFDKEVSDQYTREEKIKKKVEEKRKENKKLAKQAAEKSRIDSINQVRIDKREANKLKAYEAEIAREGEAYEKELELENKREVAAMIKAEEEAERNAYIAELNDKGIFLVNFDGETYEVNQKEWNDWKISENWDSEKEINQMKGIVRAMGSEKANGLANSMYKTLSKGISKEGITLKAIQGIQIYDVITKGNSKFN